MPLAKSSKLTSLYIHSVISFSLPVFLTRTAITTISVTDDPLWRANTPTSLPPLITIFTPPPECATRWLPDDDLAPSDIYSGVNVTQSYSGAVDSSYYSDCNPYGAVPEYSPGVCGNGQTLAVISKLIIGDETFWRGTCCNRYLLHKAPCCTYAYMFGSDMTYWSYQIYCRKTFSTPTTVQAWFNTTLIDSVGQSSTLSMLDKRTVWCSGTGFTGCDITQLKNETVLTSGTAWAAPTIVYWQPDGLSLFPSNYASSLAAVIDIPFGSSTTSSSLPSTTLSSTASSASSASSSVPPVTSQSSNSGLSPGVQAGIAVGVGVFVISGVVCLLYLLQRRKRQQQQDRRQREQPPLAQTEIPEIEGTSRGLKRFIGGQWRAETHGTSVPVEAGSSVLVEAGRTSVRIVPGPPVELDVTHASEGRFTTRGNSEEGVPF